MKKYLMLIIAIVMLMSALAVMAQNEKAYTITPRLVYNFISDSDVSDVIGDMYGISVGVDVAKFPVGFETGYLYGSKTPDYKAANIGKLKTSAIPLLATYSYPVSDAFYLKFGAGVSFNHISGMNMKVVNSNSESNTEFAWELKAGYKFSTNWSAELGYTDFGKVVEDEDSSIAAIQLGVGYSF